MDSCALGNLASPGTMLMLQSHSAMRFGICFNVLPFVGGSIVFLLPFRAVPLPLLQSVLNYKPMLIAARPG